MSDDLQKLKDETMSAVAAAADMTALEALRVSALGKKGTITGRMKALGMSKSNDVTLIVVSISRK